VGLPFATAPTTKTIGVSLFIFYAYFDISTSLAFVENAIFGAYEGRCSVTGDFTIYNSVAEDSSARIDKRLSNWANRELNLLYVRGILVEGFILIT
jgi:hypothetical protein